MNSYQGVLNYLFVKKLRKNNVSLKLYIDWHENQPIDKGIIFGLKKYYPLTSIKGYQGYIVSFDYNLHLAPTEFEIESNVIPNEICVMGTTLISEVKRFSKSINVSTAPSFRFSNFKSDNSPKIYEFNDNPKILLFLSADIDQNIYALNFLYNCKINFKLNFNIFVKFHPSLEKKIVIKKSNLNNLDFSEFEGNSNSISEIFIFSIGMASSALVESILLGIPTVVIGSMNGLLQNPIPKSFSNTLYSICYTEDDFSNIFNKFTAMKDNSYFDKVSLISDLRKHFNMNESSVKNFLDLNQ